MSGKLYGVGVGPGDPELLTLKALRLIREADVIAVPGNDPKDSVAYKIVKGAYPELDEKEIMAVPMPMTKDKDALEKAHEEGTSMIGSVLEQGRNVVFLTLGDPTVYSTYIYVHKRICGLGYETEIVSGIPSFCAVAARLNMSLVEKAEPLHVIPASYQIEEALKLPGTKVLMKAGKKMKEVKDRIKEQGADGVMIENCQMPDEKIYRSVEEIPENAGYYSLIIVKEN
ncbi:precorrin-2 C(20)-methyltransferase [Blautia sp. HCP3S3_G3]|uniref:precorrin-2 C(20)-methyltransferase n=1 Tax=Blautia sp. HCP3S3_G3 TaxID=3438913 RepID=UPI003F88EA90